MYDIQSIFNLTDIKHTSAFFDLGTQVILCIVDFELCIRMFCLN